MEENPIKQICVEYLAGGKAIRDIRPGNRVALRKEITIFFRDGRQAFHEIETEDRDQFLRWSTEATVFLQEQVA